jgi:outer membrane biogenesis lipoprotein LolB
MGPKATMNSSSISFAKPVGLVLAALAALLLSSCATLTPDQEAANAVTRHEQRAEGIQDPMKER